MSLRGAVSGTACRCGVGLSLLLVGFAAIAEESSDWPRFRGPNGSGIGVVAAGLELPTEFSAESASWSRTVLFGQSSPIVVGDKVIITGVDGERLSTMAYDAVSGSEHWRRSLPRRKAEALSSASGSALATPVSDGKAVYAFFAEFGIVAYDLEGAELWRFELPPFTSYYGMASSPILEGGVLILLCDQAMDPYMLGIDPDSGKQLWRRDRKVRAESWTTPVVHRARTDQASVITFGTFAADAFDPKTGNGKWRIQSLGPTPVSSPVVAGDMVYVVAPDQQEESAAPSLDSFVSLDSNGDGHLTKEEITSSSWASAFAWLDIDGDGLAALDEIEQQMEIMASPDFGLVAIDISVPDEPKIAWRQKKTLPYIASPIVYQDVLFLIKDGGILTSYDPATGDVLKRARIEGATEPFSPSPVAADGKLYLASNVGTIAVVTAEPQWKTVAVSDLDEEIFATPAIGNGQLFLRTRTRLLAFAGEKGR